jgi:hypothetical protein
MGRLTAMGLLRQDKAKRRKLAVICRRDPLLRYFRKKMKDKK